MWDANQPYSDDELREMRRLIVASGSAIDAWVKRTRRSAEFVRSLSPLQADVITAEALAVALDPDDLGSGEEFQAALALFAEVPADERHKALWRLLLEIRRRHYPDAE